jgi:hypothetical protein
MALNSLYTRALNMHLSFIRNASEMHSKIELQTIIFTTEMLYQTFKFPTRMYVMLLECAVILWNRSEAESAKKGRNNIRKLFTGNTTIKPSC